MEFTFLISARVPNSSPFILTEMLTSQRSDPSSIFPSHVPIYLKMDLNFLTYSWASSADLISGSDTISIKAMPDLLRSI